MNRRVLSLSLGLVAALLLTGCDALQLGVETPTPASLATLVVTSAATAAPTTVAATATPGAPTALPATPAAATLVPPTLPPAASGTPANTPEGVPTGQPTAANPTDVPGQPQVAEAVLILAPGGNSTVASPVRVAGEADPTFEQNLVVEIVDANGAVLATQATTIHGDAARGPFEVQVPFTVSAAGPGRISVFSTSPRDGGLVHLASVDVTLTNGAAAQPASGQPHNETHLILSPVPLARVSGGSLHVSGFSDYVFEGSWPWPCAGRGLGAPDPVCGTASNVLATGSAMIHAPDVGQPGPFDGDLAYQVSTTVAARLVVYSRSARDGGIVHLSTVPVQLAP